MPYTWGARSPNDPTQVPLKFGDEGQARAHAERMDQLIPLWDDPNNNFWNRDHWKVRPEPWVAAPL